jgi:hypothetical protein
MKFAPEAMKHFDAGILLKMSLTVPIVRGLVIRAG